MAQTPAARAITQAGELEGVWALSDPPGSPPLYWLFRPDGTYSIARQPDGSRSLYSGKYWFENGIFYSTNDLCPTPGQYRLAISQPPDQEIKLEFTLVEDACEGRKKDYTQAEVTWPEPLQPSAAEPPPMPLAGPGPFYPGNRSLTLLDESRGGRKIEVSLWYPAKQEKDSSSVA